MSRDELEASIIDIIRKRHPDFSLEVSRGIPFTELGVDSIELLNLAFEIEEGLNISIETEDLRKVRTIDDLLQLVESIVTSTGR